MVEYVFLIALIAVVCVGAVRALSTKMDATFNEIGGALSTPGGHHPPASPFF